MSRLDAIRGRLHRDHFMVPKHFKDVAWLVETVDTLTGTLKKIRAHPCANVQCACCQEDGQWAQQALARLEEPE